MRTLIEIAQSINLKGPIFTREYNGGHLSRSREELNKVSYNRQYSYARMDFGDCEPGSDCDCYQGDCDCTSNDCDND